jgi:hypothetical protein
MRAPGHSAASRDAENNDIEKAADDSAKYKEKDSKKNTHKLLLRSNIKTWVGRCPGISRTISRIPMKISGASCASSARCQIPVVREGGTSDLLHYGPDMIRTAGCSRRGYSGVEIITSRSRIGRQLRYVRWRERSERRWIDLIIDKISVESILNDADIGCPLCVTGMHATLI